MPGHRSAFEVVCPDKLTFGAALQKFRKIRGLATQKLSELTGGVCTRAQIQRWEAGKALPTHVFFVNRICLAMGCNDLEVKCLLRKYTCETLEERGLPCP